MKKPTLQIQLEKDLALLLLTKLYKKEVDFNKAREIARYILKTIPQDISETELRRIIPRLDDKFTELCPIVIKYLNKQEETKTNEKITKIRRMLVK